jgi:purine nucleosidase
MAKKIIFDCDNTMGVKGCDVDDGLALLYLLGKPGADILGITTTYGNSDLHTVYANTCTMLEEIGRADIPAFKGCPNSLTYESEAVDFLVDTVSRYPGEISLLATGSLTNLLAAYYRDPLFWEKIAEIVIMGGITEELVLNGKVLAELNFSCDPLAAKYVLEKGKNMTIITGNCCLDAFFPKEEFYERLGKRKEGLANYIYEKCHYWFEDMMEAFQLDGFHNWDVVAAAYLLEPYLFKDCSWSVGTNPENLSKGLLSTQSEDGLTYLINTPLIKDRQTLIDDVYNTMSSSKHWIRR